MMNLAAELEPQEFAPGGLRSQATEIDWMATRENRWAQFAGGGGPPPDQPVEVLCEDHSGTYQLPFACRWVDGEWRNNESGGPVEAPVVGWGLPCPRREERG